MPEFIAQHTPDKLNPFVRGYLEAAEWLIPEDQNKSDVDGFHPDTLEQAIKDCEEFQRNNATDLDIYYDISDRPVDHAGHDFWLSRSGSGSGFWDRGHHPVFKRLHDAAQKFGEVSSSADGEFIYIE